MTTQQESYIESRLEAYREELEDKDVLWIEEKVEGVLEEAECDKENDRLVSE